GASDRRRARRTAPGSKGGACVYGDNPGTCEIHASPREESAGMADRLNKRPGAERQSSAVTASPEREPRTKEGSEVSVGEREASRREGRGEVVATHGTEGQQ